MPQENRNIIHSENEQYKTSSTTTYIIKKSFTKESIIALIEESLTKTLSTSKDKWKYENEHVINIVSVTRQLMGIAPNAHSILFTLTIMIEQYREFNALALTWTFPESIPLRLHWAVFNYYFNISIQEYLYK